MRVAENLLDWNCLGFSTSNPLLALGVRSRFRIAFDLSLIHISEPTRQAEISYAVFCLKKFFFNDTATTEIYTLHIVGSVRCV